jgi:hypothetical protein
LYLELDSPPACVVASRGEEGRAAAGVGERWKSELVDFVCRAW